MSCVKQQGAEPAAKGENGLDFNPFEVMEPRAPEKTPKEFRNGARVKSQDIAPEGVYRPDYNMLTPHMRSPEYVQISTAAAITLGVAHGRMYRCSCTRCC
jgi:biotin synthase